VTSSAGAPGPPGRGSACRAAAASARLAGSWPAPAVSSG